MSDETKNVKISVEYQVNEQLAGSYTIHWPSEEFDSDALTEWIEVIEIGYSGVPSRSSERNERWGVAFNVYSKPGLGGETSHAIYELVDAILGVFDQATIPVYDWADADPTSVILSYLRFNEATVTPVDPPEELGKFLKQRNVYFEPVLIVGGL